MLIVLLVSIPFIGRNHVCLGYQVAYIHKMEPAESLLHQGRWKENAPNSATILYIIPSEGWPLSGHTIYFRWQV